MSNHSAMEAYRSVVGKVHTYTDEAVASRAAIAELEAERDALRARYTHRWTQAVEGVETEFEVELVPKPELEQAEAERNKWEWVARDIAGAFPRAAAILIDAISRWQPHEGGEG